jgi:hypothetical protein
MGRPLPSPAIRICYRSISHRENDAELRLAAHHPRVAFRRFFERISFNHGTHTCKFGEVQGVFGIRRCSRGPALKALTSADELDRCDLNRIE